jgi:hypothetical protein
LYTSVRLSGFQLSVLLGALVLPLAPPAGDALSLRVFVNGQTPDAEEANGNFDLLEAAVVDNDTRIKAAQLRVVGSFDAGSINSRD